MAKVNALSAFRAIAEPINQSIARARAEMEAERQATLQDAAHVSADAAEAIERLDAACRERDAAIHAAAAAMAELATVQKQLRASEDRHVAERNQQRDALAALRAQAVEDRTNWNRDQQRIRERMETAINEAAELRGKLSVYAVLPGAQASVPDVGAA